MCGNRYPFRLGFAKSLGCSPDASSRVAGWTNRANPGWRPQSPHRLLRPRHSGPHSDGAGPQLVRVHYGKPFPQRSAKGKRKSIPPRNAESACEATGSDVRLQAGDRLRRPLRLAVAPRGEAAGPQEGRHQWGRTAHMWPSCLDLAQPSPKGTPGRWETPGHPHRSSPPP